MFYVAEATVMQHSLQNLTKHQCISTGRDDSEVASHETKTPLPDNYHNNGT